VVAQLQCFCICSRHLWLYALLLQLGTGASDLYTDAQSQLRRLHECYCLSESHMSDM